MGLENDCMVHHFWSKMVLSLRFLRSFRPLGGFPGYSQVRLDRSSGSNTWGSREDCAIESTRCDNILLNQGPNFFFGFSIHRSHPWGEASYCKKIQQALDSSTTPLVTQYWYRAWHLIPSPTSLVSTSFYVTENSTSHFRRPPNAFHTTFEDTKQGHGGLEVPSSAHICSTKPKDSSCFRIEQAVWRSAAYLSSPWSVSCWF